MGKAIFFLALFVNMAFLKAQDPQKLLNEAIMSGIIDNVKAAVEKYNADVNKPYKDKVMNNYPLHAACFVANVEMVNYLLEKGADVNTLNKFEATPVSVICNQTIQDEATTEKMIAIINALLVKKADLNILSKGGYSPLGYAAEHNNTKVVKLLLDNGADPNLRGGGKFSHTPLMYAAKFGNLDMVKALVEKKAKINEIREHLMGTTVITENAASMASEGNFMEVLSYLKDNGAKAPKGRKIWK